MRTCLARIHLSGARTYTCEKTIGTHMHFRSRAGTWLVLHTAPLEGGAATISWEASASDDEQAAWLASEDEHVWEDLAAADERKGAQSTEGRSPSSDLEILGHNSTGGGEGVENVSSAEHVRGAPPITDQSLPTPDPRLRYYDPQRHARIVWDNIHSFTARTFGGSPARAVTADERRVEVYAIEEIAAMLTRSHAIGFEAGRACRCTQYLSGSEDARAEIHNVLDKIDPGWALDRAKEPRARVLHLVTSIRNVMASYREAIAVVEDLHKLADRAHSISNFAKVSGP